MMLAESPQDDSQGAFRTIEAVGHLDFAQPALNRAVPLEGATTLGDLIRRTAEATNLEIYADRRIGALPVTLLAAPEATVRAGDLLRALALAVTGAYRRLDSNGETAYVLTDDREGIAPRRLRLHDKASDVEANTSLARERAEQGMRAANLARRARFDANDYSLGPDVMADVERKMRQATEPSDALFGYLPVPVLLLPPDVRNEVQRQLSQHKKDYTSETPPDEVLQEDQIWVSLSLGTTLVVPGVGEFSGPPLSDLKSLLSPEEVTATKPGSAPSPPRPEYIPTGSALLVSATTPAEARTAVQAARVHGFSRVWLRVSASDTPLLNAALAEARREKPAVSVFAAVSLLRVPIRDSNLPRDINLFGETAGAFLARRGEATAFSPEWYGIVRAHLSQQRGADWLDIATPAARAEAVRRAAAPLQGVSGLAGLVLLDAAADGYGLDFTHNEGYGPSADTMGLQMGYTPALRLAFLRRENVDPIDLLETGDTPSPRMSDLPFFPEAFQPAELPRQVRDPRTGAWRTEKGDSKRLSYAWDDLRRAEADRQLASLVAALRGALPAGICLVLADRSDFNTPDPAGYSSIHPAWYAEWPSSQAAPPRETDRLLQIRTRLPRTAAAPTRPAWWIAAQPFSSDPPTAQDVADWVKDARKEAAKHGGFTAGIVLDLSSLPITQALPTLSGLAAAPTASPSRVGAL